MQNKKVEIKSRKDSASTYAVNYILEVNTCQDYGMIVCDEKGGPYLK